MEEITNEATKYIKQITNYTNKERTDELKQ